MLRKILILGLTILMVLNLSSYAEFSDFENEIPDEPILTETDLLSITAVYHPETDRSVYTVCLKDSAVFPDGSPVTAQDVLFTLYTLLDPGYSGSSELPELSIPGLFNYRAQISQEHYDAAMNTMNAIRAAGPDHAWSSDDSWSEAAHNAWWSLASAYETACDTEFPICARRIVDVCTSWLAPDGPGAFGLTAEELIAATDLHVAHTMLEWGYASLSEDLTLRGLYSGTVWQLDGGFAPVLDDFVTELRLAYDDDLALCWAVEGADDYEPTLPDIESEFVRALYAGSPDPVLSIEGIRTPDDRTLEIDLEGIDLRSEYELLGHEILSLAHFGDASLWAPETGSYGHPFGDTSAVEALAAQDAGAHSARLLEEAFDEFSFG